MLGVTLTQKNRLLVFANKRTKSNLKRFCVANPGKICSINRVKSKVQMEDFYKDPDAKFLRNCKFKFRCFKGWDDLEETDQIAVRFCGECKKPVYYCETQEQLNFAIANDKCVAIRRDHPSGRLEQLSLGQVIYPWPQPIRVSNPSIDPTNGEANIG